MYPTATAEQVSDICAQRHRLIISLQGAQITYLSQILLTKLLQKITPSAEETRLTVPKGMFILVPNAALSCGAAEADLIRRGNGSAACPQTET
jgi:hypothetical protein